MLLAVCYLLQFKASYFSPLHVEVISLLISIVDVNKFKSKLKTFLFKRVYELS